MLWLSALLALASPEDVPVQAELRGSAVVFRCETAGTVLKDAEDLVLVWSINGSAGRRSWAPPESLWPPGTARRPQGKVASPMRKAGPGLFQLEVPTDPTVLSVHYRVESPSWKGPRSRRSYVLTLARAEAAPAAQAEEPVQGSSPAASTRPSARKGRFPECWRYKDKYSVRTAPENSTLYESWGGKEDVVTQPVTFDRKSWSDDITLHWRSGDFGGSDEVERVLADSENVFKCMKDYFGVSWMQRKPTAYYVKEDLYSEVSQRRWSGLAFGDKLYLATGEAFSVSVMAHELTHFLKLAPSPALTEGLAKFIQLTWRRQDPSEVLDALHSEAARRLAAAPLKTSLVKLDQPSYYGTDRGYVLAASLIAFLIVEEDRFNELMSYIENRDFRVSFGDTPEEVEERWREFLGRRK
ncbi:MAG TPA: hypothetical protein DCM05_11650 [Elusimicrobia bacterium]|nr:hypothetical protein [Elusimicrobiota bacterium]